MSNEVKVNATPVWLVDEKGEDSVLEKQVPIHPYLSISD
jgi:hypothetical protein